MAAIRRLGIGQWRVSRRQPLRLLWPPSLVIYVPPSLRPYEAVEVPWEDRGCVLEQILAMQRGWA